MRLLAARRSARLCLPPCAQTCCPVWVLRAAVAVAAAAAAARMANPKYML